MTTAKSLTEEDVETFLTKLRLADNDKKVDQIQFFSIKLEDAGQLPESTIDALTLTLSPYLKSPSQLLLTSILSNFLPIYLPLIPPTSALRLPLNQFLPPLLDRLNDPKERIHTLAANNVLILGKKAYEADTSIIAGMKGKEKENMVGFWERNLREVLAGKGWRGKVEGMKVLLRMREEDVEGRFGLKPWIAPLVDLLEDGDGGVRDQARETVIALLSPPSTPAAARTELKKLLSAKNVRKTIADGILTRVLGGGTAVATPATEVPPSGESANGVTEARSGAATPAVTGDDVEVVYVASGRDLEGEFGKMVPFFEGKETEHNWAPREKSILRIRGMLRGGAFKQYPDHFLAGLKSGIMDGISKTLLSLRTTVAQQSTAAVQELAEHLGGSFDYFVEALLVVLGKMAGFTKKIISDKSQKSLNAIIVHSTCGPRVFISHIMAGIQEKNIQIRQNCTAHLKTFLDVQAARSKPAIDSNPDLLSTLEEAIKKSLADVNAPVRDLARAAFWSFHGIWPQRATLIMATLDASAKKQLEKANPGGVTDGGGPADRAPAPKKPQASSAMSQLVAERRRAKALELAAGEPLPESPRIVSQPAPASPSIPQSPMPRSISSTQGGPSRISQLNRTMTSPEVNGSPVPRKSINPSRNGTAGAPKAQLGSPRDLLSRSRSSSMGRTLSTSPDSSRGSPLRKPATFSSGMQSPSSSSGTSGPHDIRTPKQARAPLPTFTHDPPAESLFKPEPIHQNGRSQPTPSRTLKSPINPTHQAQAVQALTSAQQLLDLSDEDDLIDAQPITPARPPGRLPQPNMLKTPVSMFVNGSGVGSSGGSGRGGRVWEDSPRSEAMTPQMLGKLKERKFERSWWVKHQILLDKASPLRTNGPSPTSSIREDVEMLVSGQPDLRNLQKLALFSTSHPISTDGMEDLDDDEERQIWEQDGLFDRIFQGLADFLEPSRPLDLLEQGLVVLWEMVQNQWVLFEDREPVLVDLLFRLRASKSITILESTNSLISLLTELMGSPFLLGIIHSSLESFLSAHGGVKVGNGNGASRSEEAIRTSGFLFGLTALGMCMLRFPREAVLIEGAKLAPLIMTALKDENVTIRQAANTLILAIQCVLSDAQATLALLPDLDAGQLNLAHYLFEKNGLTRKPMTPGFMGEGERREKVVSEMAGLMSRGVAR